MASPQNIHQTLEHLFRHESGKLIAVLTKIFGPHNIELAEDVVQDTLLSAMNSWKMNAIPDNPSAWLFTVAKNKALDVIRKQRRHRDYAADISYLLRSEYTLSATLNEMMSRDHINDDLLRMMFACCHPSLPAESQVALILKTLCGFSISEIAKAFVTTSDTIDKRLYRARQRFRQQEILLDIPGMQELELRLENVMTAIYLLFNEGYNSTQHDQLIRKDLLQESLRLGQLLLQNPATKQSRVFALLALICFNTARSEARLDKDGNILVLEKQDRTLWDRSLIDLGLEYMDQSAEGEDLTTYHIEAAIAAKHVSARSYQQTDWKSILQYYDVLYRLRPSAIVGLNRAVVISELEGPAAAIVAIDAIPDIVHLKNYYLLPAILGDLYLKLNEKGKAIALFTDAARLTSSEAEKKLLADKIRQSGVESR